MAVTKILIDYTEYTRLKNAERQLDDKKIECKHLQKMINEKRPESESAVEEGQSDHVQHVQVGDGAHIEEDDKNSREIKFQRDPLASDLETPTAGLLPSVTLPGPQQARIVEKKIDTTPPPPKSGVYPLVLPIREIKDKQVKWYYIGP
jgi:hypothetical protein